MAPDKSVLALALALTLRLAFCSFQCPFGACLIVFISEDILR